MQPRRRRAPAPWERRSADPCHPIGRARRRWPRAYDGGGGDAQTVERRVSPRYRRAYREDRNSRQIPTGLARLRESPVRNGLIGLAIAGAAAPVAVSRYQDALRTDQDHERHLALAPVVASGPVDDEAVSEAWADLETDRARDETIEEFVARYSDYQVTRDLAETIYDSAAEHDIEPEVAFGLVRAESSFKNTSTSPVGAVGLTQLMPRTAAWLEPGTTVKELRKPETNLRIGFKYLRSLIDKYDGDTALALTAYNRGPGTVDKALKRGQNPDNGYADFVYGKESHGHRLYTSR